VVAKATDAQMYMKVRYKHSVSPTLLATLGHPQEGMLQRMDTLRYQQKFVNHCTGVKYWVLKFMGWNTYFCICILNLPCIFKT
jgi:hypothetical protein